MELKQTIYDIVERHLPDDTYFIVDVVIKATKGPKKVLILIDADEGVNIDACADVSRAVGNEIEADSVIEDAYRLEVSSPGVDYPLQNIRQYQKNIGRTVKITLEDKELEGVLKAVNSEDVVVDQIVKAGKKKEYKEVPIPLSEIKKTIVQISFK